MIWPSTTVPGAGTINGMRGLNLKIADRFDLTLECVRRHYGGGESPLSAVLKANAAFFDLWQIGLVGTAGPASWYCCSGDPEPARA